MLGARPRGVQAPEHSQITTFCEPPQFHFWVTKILFLAATKTAFEIALHPFFAWEGAANCVSAFHNGWGRGVRTGFRTGPSHGMAAVPNGSNGCAEGGVGWAGNGENRRWTPVAARHPGPSERDGRAGRADRGVSAMVARPIAWAGGGHGRPRFAELRRRIGCWRTWSKSAWRSTAVTPSAAWLRRGRRGSWVRRSWVRLPASWRPRTRC